MERARVILADDHDLLIRGIETVLEPHHEVIARASNGMELVKAAQELIPDVVVSDISMPILDGLSAASRIRRLVPGAKIVLVTVKDDPAIVRHAHITGVHAYIHKSAASHQLLFAIAEVLRGRKYFGVEVPQRHDDPAASSSDLTFRQIEVLQLLGQGMTMRQVGQTLNISTRTVAFHKYRIMEQLGISTNTDLIRHAHIRSV